MSELKIFENSEFGAVRTVEVGDKTYFVGNDVAKALGYAKPQNAIASHCRGALKRGIGVQTGVKADGTPAIQEVEMLVIPEGDIYRLVVKSQLPSAERFESWIYDEVIPSIRKHGMYAMDELINDPELAIKAFTALKEERQRNKMLEEENENMKPKALFADAVAASNTSILIGDLAKLICQNGYEIGQKRMFEWLRDNGYLVKSGNSKNMPMQRYLEQGLFEIKESNVVNPDGSIRITRTTKVTGKGQVYFVQKFLQSLQNGEV